jgi:hypothetical protein
MKMVSTREMVSYLRDQALNKVEDRFIERMHFLASMNRINQISDDEIVELDNMYQSYKIANL